MSDLFNLKEELQQWAETYGEEKTSKVDAIYWRIDYKHGRRRKLFVILLNHLKELGADKDIFTSGPKRDQIIKFSIAPKSVLGSKYGGAVICAARDLDGAVRDVFGTDSQYYKENGKTRTKKEEKSKKKLSLEEKVQQEEEKEPIEAVGKADEVKKVYPPPPPFKKFDKSMTQQPGVEPMPETEPNYDPEMRKWLGYKDK